MARMQKNRIGLIVMFLVLVAVTVMFSSGCSPTTGEWTGRGREGLAKAQHNDKLWYDKLMKAEDTKLSRIITGAFADIEAARDGKLPSKATTQPSGVKDLAAMGDGIAKPTPEAQSQQLTDKWLKDHQIGLELAVAVWAKRRQELRDEYDAMQRNLKLTGECFDNVDKLNKAWAITNKTLSDQVADLTVLIREMKTDNAAAGNQ